MFMSEIVYLFFITIELQCKMPFIKKLIVNTLLVHIIFMNIDGKVLIKQNGVRRMNNCIGSQYHNTLKDNLKFQHAWLF